MIGSVRGWLRKWERRDCFLALYVKDEKRGERCVKIFDNPLQLIQWKYGCSEPTQKQINRVQTIIAISRHLTEIRQLQLMMVLKHSDGLNHLR